MQGEKVSSEDVELIWGLSDYRDSVKANIKKLQAELKTLKNTDFADKFSLSKATISDILQRRKKLI